MHVMSASTRVVLVLAFLAAAATARAHERDEGWTRSPQPAFTTNDGDLCPFALGGEPLTDEVMVKTLATFPDGSPREQIYKGKLVFRFTNLDSGASVVRDLSGDGLDVNGKDGSQIWTYIGPEAVAFFAGDNVPAGLYVLNGFHVIYYSADGSTRRLTPTDGPMENLCDTLR
jgi:hypothetical protein